MTRNTKSRRSAEDEQSLLHHLHLPEDIIEEILLWLPVKSLLRFCCVAKSWLSLIGSDRFIKTHLKNSTKNTKLAHHRVVFNHRNRYLMSECSLHSLLSLKEGSPPTNNQPKAGNLVGCCNGVLCFFNQLDGSFLLWNPATRVSIELPKADHVVMHVKCGFGWDESSDAYKVFAVMFDCNINQRVGKVYSSETNSWKTVELGCLFLHRASGQFVGGKIHWATYNKHCIESFDLESEEFGRIELPLNAKERFYSTWLGEIKGCLCVVCDHRKESRLDVWVMKAESWFKLLTCSLAFCERTIYALSPLLGEDPNGEIFLIYGDTFLLYNHKDGVFTTTAKNITSFCEARVYVESLVSPRRILGDYETSPVKQLANSAAQIGQLNRQHHSML